MVQAVLGGRGGRTRRRGAAHSGPRAGQLRSDDPASKGTNGHVDGRGSNRAACPGGGRQGGSTSRGSGGGWTAALGLDLECPSVESRLHSAISIGPVEPRTAGLDPPERLRCRMAIRVHCADGDDRDARPNRVEEGVGRRRPAAVMGDLEQVHPGQAARQQDRVDLLLDVACQQEALGAERPEEDDRDVVDRRPAIGWVSWDGVPVGPQHLETDRVEAQPIAGREELRGPAFEGEAGPEGVIRGTRPDHARLEDPPDPVAVDEPGQTASVILVRMAQDQDVDSPIPWWDSRVELEDQTIWIGTPVDQHPGTAIALDEDRIALADVEDRDVDPAVGTGLEPGAGDGQGEDEAGQDCNRRPSRSPRAWLLVVPAAQARRAFRARKVSPR
jgi:hypothetical protein